MSFTSNAVVFLCLDKDVDLIPNAFVYWDFRASSERFTKRSTIGKSLNRLSLEMYFNDIQYDCCIILFRVRRNKKNLIIYPLCPETFSFHFASKTALFMAIGGFLGQNYESCLVILSDIREEDLR